MSQFLSADQMGLAVAVGCGLLIGLERERRKGQGPDRKAAGLRTFMVAALAGAVAQMVSAALAAVALGGVVALTALSYWRSRSEDPGLTTELALIATALIGMLAVHEPALAAACGALLAGVLAAKEHLHHFATHWLTERELHDALLLSALALVLLPLLPTAPVSWLGQLSPQRVLMLVIVILLMQAGGHVAQRLLGARSGLAVSGLLGGFVSSTATIGAMGGLARSGQVSLRLALCAAVLSMVATWLQVLVMASVVSPVAVAQLWPLLGVGVSVPLILGALLWRQDGAMPASLSGQEAVLRIREAVMVVALLLGGAVVVNAAQQRGMTGLLLGTGVAALADAHAPVASLMSLFSAGRLTAEQLFLGVLVAISANALTRSAVAGLSGGWRFGVGVALALAVNLTVAWGWVLGAQRGFLR
ncbi:MAG: MgtC/SapB family protein [Acidobacteriota bacterium]